MTGVPIPFVDPRSVLKKHGIRPKRSWGQNFLVSQRALGVIAEACVAGGAGSVRVVEIGAGVGTLTGVLLQKGARVSAVERDREMCDILRAELGGVPGFELFETDAAQLDYADLFGNAPGVVVGNLPYQLTGRLIRGVVEGRERIARAVLMVQKEVGERLAAPPGHRRRGALSVIVQARFRTRVIHRLKPTAFHPPPKVSSSVVRFDPLERTVFDNGLNPSRFDTVVNASFSGRRKTLRNALVAAGIADRDRVGTLLAEAGVEPGLRSERLSVDDFARLTAASVAMGLDVRHP